MHTLSIIIKGLQPSDGNYRIITDKPIHEKDKLIAGGIEWSIKNAYPIENGFVAYIEFFGEHKRHFPHLLDSLLGSYGLLKTNALTLIETVGQKRLFKDNAYGIAFVDDLHSDFYKELDSAKDQPDIQQFHKTYVEWTYSQTKRK